MSIIQEALKKPKNILPPAGSNDVLISPKGKEANEVFLTKKGKGINSLLNMRLRNRTIALFFYILAGVLFIMYIFALFRSPAAPSPGPSYSAIHRNGVKRSAPVVRPVTDNPSSQAATSINVFKARFRFPDFVLNGIMQLVDGPRAIINNVIVGIGDVIGGATVEKINKNNVVLKMNESVITLKMK
ncbi:MAG: hypothetical protein Q8N91_01115 [Candidatus Omnitrophota bacterium]|nr:hypothetical protein [Candidatus Omnitrophota bacterium]